MKTGEMGEIKNNIVMGNEEIFLACRTRNVGFEKVLNLVLDER